MVEAMIWLIIAALLSSSTIQAIQQYRTAAIVYQMKNDLKNAADLAAARGVLTGFIAEEEVVYSVNHSDKSDGVTMSWGKFNVTDENPNDTAMTDADPNTEAMGEAENFGFARASVIEPTGDKSHDNVSYEGVVTVDGQEVAVDKTLVIVARHDEAPDIRVFYFFDSIYVYKKGPADFPVDALPPVQDMPETSPSVDPPASEEEEAPTPETPQEPTTAPEPEPTPEETATQEPIESPAPTPEPTVTVAPPAPSTAPSAEATQAPAPEPSPTPSATPKPTAPAVDPTPEPDPLIPAANRDPKTKKFLFCHNGEMHSNSFTGMVQGHEHHAEDIMPPIPPENYPGWNWNAKTAKIYYNNCVPL